MNGIIEKEGEIEMCVNGVWGSICPDGWDDTDAYVICKQLGYAEQGVLTHFYFCFCSKVLNPAEFETCI